MEKTIKEIERGTNRFSFLYGLQLVIQMGTKMCAKITDNMIEEIIKDERKYQKDDAYFYSPEAKGEGYRVARELSQFADPFTIIKHALDFGMNDTKVWALAGRSKEIGTFQPEVFASYEAAKRALDDYVAEYNVDDDTVRLVDENMAKSEDGYTVFWIEEVEVRV